MLNGKAKSVTSLALAFLLSLLWVQPSSGASPWASSGPQRVITQDRLILKDAARKKSLEVRVHYPDIKEPAPVILFSHGAGGSKDGYGLLAERWASHGFVVIQPSHADSIELQRSQGKNATLREVVEDIDSDAKGWSDRVADLRLILDHLDDIEKAIHGPMLDRARVGVGGHSYGAFTAMLIGGTVVDLPTGEKNRSFVDRRVKAILALSPQGRGLNGLHDRSWNAVTIPMMQMTGSLDRGRNGSTPEQREDGFRLSPAGNKYLLFLDGANHMLFTGMVLEGNQNRGPLRRRMRERVLAGSGDAAELFGYVQEQSTAFWCAYVGGDESAKKFLESEEPVKRSRGRTRLERR